MFSRAHFTILASLCGIALLTTLPARAWNPNALQMHQPAAEMSFPRGYDVVAEPSASAVATKKMPAGTAVVAAHLDTAGRRYYMTDWSYERYSKGLGYFWIRVDAETTEPAAARGLPGGAVAAGLVVLRQKEDLSFPGGYEVVSETGASATVLKQMPDSRSAMVAAYQEVGGVRYYMTDWSYDRFTKEGIRPNWIRSLGAGTGPALVGSAATLPPPSGNIELTAEDIRLLELYEWGVGELGRNAEAELLKRAQHLYPASDWRHWYLLGTLDSTGAYNLTKGIDEAVETARLDTANGLRIHAAYTNNYDMEEGGPLEQAMEKDDAQSYWLDYIMSRNCDASSGSYETFAWFARTYGPTHFLTFDVAAWAAGPTFKLSGYGRWNRIRYETLKAFRERFPVITRENVRGYTGFMRDCLGGRNRDAKLGTQLFFDISRSVTNFSQEDFKEIFEGMEELLPHMVLPEAASEIEELLAQLSKLEAAKLVTYDSEGYATDALLALRLGGLCRLGRAGEAESLALQKLREEKGESAANQQYRFEEIWRALPLDTAAGKQVATKLEQEARPVLEGSALLLIAQHDLEEGRISTAVFNLLAALPGVRKEHESQQDISIYDPETKIIAQMVRQGHLAEADKVARRMAAEAYSPMGLALTAKALGRHNEAADIYGKRAQQIFDPARDVTYPIEDVEVVVEALLNYSKGGRPEAGRELLAKCQLTAAHLITEESPVMGTAEDGVLHALFAVQAHAELADYATVSKAMALDREMRSYLKLAKEMDESPAEAKDVSSKLERIRELALMKLLTKDQEVELRTLKRTVSEILHFLDDEDVIDKRVDMMAQVGRSFGSTVGVEYFCTAVGADDAADRHYCAAVRLPGQAPQVVDCGRAQPVDEAILKLGSLMRLQVEQIDETTLSSLLRQLHEALAQPWRGLLRSEWKHVCVCPAGDLHFVPWTMLLNGQGEFLGTDYEVVTAPNLLALARQQKTTTTPLAERPVVLVGNPAFELDAGGGASEPRRGADLAAAFAITALPSGVPVLGELPGTVLEVGNISSLVKRQGLKVVELTNARATEEAVRAIVRPSILHLATHGLFLASLDSPAPRITAPRNETEDETSNQEPLDYFGALEVSLSHPLFRSAMALSGANVALSRWQDGQMTAPGRDGLLTAAEAAEMNLRGTELVVLSACDTGLGSTRSAAGVQGLQMAFQQAGAQRLLFTLWPVADTETVDFMTGFYSRLAGQADIASAFTAAQREAVQSCRREKGLAAAVTLYGPFVMLLTGAKS